MATLRPRDRGSRRGVGRGDCGAEAKWHQRSDQRQLLTMKRGGAVIISGNQKKDRRRRRTARWRTWRLCWVEPPEIGGPAASGGALR